MKNFHMIAKLPEILGAVLSDPAGALIESFGSTDAEAAAAVHSFSAQSLGQAGDLLGLGTLDRVSIVGPTRVCTISKQSDGVLGVYVDPTKPLASIEKKIQDTLRI